MRAIDMRCRPPIEALQNNWLLSADLENYEMTRFYGSIKPAEKRDKTLEECLRDMDMAEIKFGVVPCRKADFKHDWNNQISQLIDEYPDRFIGLLGVDACDPEVAVSDIQNYVLNGNFTGVNLEPSMVPTGSKPIDFDDESIFPIYELCEKHDIPVTIMTGGVQTISDAPYQAQKRIHALSRTFPNLKTCYTHGNWPYFRECTIEMYHNPNIYVCPDSFIVNYVGWRDWVDAANYILQDQIMFGTCYPVQPYDKIVNYYIHEAGFRTEVLPKVMYDNAARFLGIDFNTNPIKNPFISISKNNK